MFGEGSEVVLATSGVRARVERVLGEGGQGTVYEVRTGHGDRLALKWYHPHSATEPQRQLIMDLISRPAPSPRFLWPLDLSTAATAPGFGYVMPLRPPAHIGLAALMEGHVEVSLHAIFTMGFQLADAYLMLHAQGLCYRDISFGNVFFDPGSGDVLICDNDNVGIDGESTSAVIGTKRFMAPEIVRREARPSSDTDRYSLAVLLFYLLMVGHPLLGRRELAHRMWDHHAEQELFGRSPVFVFDEQDETNRPVPGVHDAVLANWPIYPTSLRELFVRAFTVGLRDPRNGRVRESQWRAEMIRCRDLLRRCAGCGADNVFDPVVDGASCWRCEQELAPPICIRLPNSTVVLNGDTVLSSHHIGVAAYDFDHVVGRVARHPQLPNVWGLRNVSEQSWTAGVPAGSDVDVQPGRLIALAPGTRIDFGRAVGSIVIS